MNGFEKLEVWKKAHELTLAIYKVTNKFPNDERFGITSQIRRSSSSVAANIAEGNSRRTEAEYINFLYIAKGSLEETKYFVILAKDLGYLSSEKYDQLEELSVNTGKLLNGLLKYLKNEN